MVSKIFIFFLLKGKKMSHIIRTYVCTNPMCKNVEKLADRNRETIECPECGRRARKTDEEKVG
jgi:hypothetical protein